MNPMNETERVHVFVAWGRSGEEACNWLIESRQPVVELKPRAVRPLGDWNDFISPPKPARECTSIVVQVWDGKEVRDAVVVFDVNARFLSWRCPITGNRVDVHVWREKSP